MEQPAASREVVIDIERDNVNKQIENKLLSWVGIFANLFFSLFKPPAEGRIVEYGSRSRCSSVVAHGNGYNKAPGSADLIGILTFGVGALIGVVAEYDRSVIGWHTASKVFYGLLIILTFALLGIGVMMTMVAAGSTAMLTVADKFARLGSILSISLIIVAISCKMGPWGFLAGILFAVVASGIMGVIWMLGRAVRLRGPSTEQQQPRGDDANV